MVIDHTYKKGKTSVDEAETMNMLLINHIHTLISAFTYTHTHTPTYTRTYAHTHMHTLTTYIDTHEHCTPGAHIHIHTG